MTEVIEEEPRILNEAELLPDILDRSNEIVGGKITPYVDVEASLLQSLAQSHLIFGRRLLYGDPIGVLVTSLHDQHSVAGRIKLSYLSVTINDRESGTE